MTLRELLILYVGDSTNGDLIRSTAKLDGGYVHVPEHMMQALGMYITYVPDVIVIDSAVSYSDDVLNHLRSVEARPILLLTDVAWSARSADAAVFTMSRSASAEEILEAARQLGSGNYPVSVPVLNGYRRTG